MDGHPSPLCSSSRNNQAWRFSLRRSDRGAGPPERLRKEARPVM